MGFEASDAVLELAVSNSTGPIDLPGHRVNRVGETLVLTEGERPDAARLRHGADRRHVEFRYELDVPGEVAVPEAACAISAEVAGGARPARRSGALAVGGARQTGCRRRQRACRPSGGEEPASRGRLPGLSACGATRNCRICSSTRKSGREMRDSIPVVVDAAGRRSYGSRDSLWQNSLG